MTTEELEVFIKENIPNFIDVSIIQNGIGYHYSIHTDKILSEKKFKGAKIDDNLDCTQQDISFLPATDPGGVVFAYEELSDAIEEGYAMPGDELTVKILKVSFSSAIKALHEQEYNLTGAPHTLLILVDDILDFEIVHPK
jgi:hypothetical protein